MKMVQCCNHHLALSHFVSSGKDEIHHGGPAWLIGRVVHSLHFFDILLLEVKLLNDICGHESVIREVVIYQLLEKAFLYSRIGDKTVYQPR